MLGSRTTSGHDAQHEGDWQIGTNQVRGLPPTRTGVSNAGAKQAGEAIHARGGGGGGGAGAFSGTSATDSHLGKAIASGHQEKVYGDPASKNRVVGYRDTRSPASGTIGVK